MFANLHSCGRFAWGAAALAYFYEHLGDASFAHTRQLVGYLTFLVVQNYFLLWSCLLLHC